MPMMMIAAEGQRYEKSRWLVLTLQSNSDHRAYTACPLAAMIDW